MHMKISHYLMIVEIQWDISLDSWHYSAMPISSSCSIHNTEMGFKGLAIGGVRSVTIILSGNGIADASSNPGRGCLHFILFK